MTDLEAPVLNSISRIDNNTRGGDTIRFQIDATDNVSVERILVSWLNDFSNRLNVTLTQSDGLWLGSLPSNIQAGNYRLENIELRDQRASLLMRFTINVMVEHRQS